VEDAAAERHAGRRSDDPHGYLHLDRLVDVDREQVRMEQDAHHGIALELLHEHDHAIEPAPGKVDQRVHARRALVQQVVERLRIELDRGGGRARAVADGRDAALRAQLARVALATSRARFDGELMFGRHDSPRYETKPSSSIQSHYLPEATSSTSLACGSLRAGCAGLLDEQGAHALLVVDAPDRLGQE